MIITVLLVVVADPARQRPGCRPVLAPLVSSAAWLATILLYTGGHALYYRSQSSALLSLAGGAAVLGFIFFCVQGRLTLQVGERVERAARARGELPAQVPGVNWPDVARRRRSDTRPLDLPV
jgi:hypothetical protein